MSQEQERSSTAGTPAPAQTTQPETERADAELDQVAGGAISHVGGDVVINHEEQY